MGWILNLTQEIDEQINQKYLRQIMEKSKMVSSLEKKLKNPESVSNFELRNN